MINLIKYRLQIYSLVLLRRFFTNKMTLKHFFKLIDLTIQLNNQFAVDFLDLQHVRYLN